MMTLQNCAIMPRTNEKSKDIKKTVRATIVSDDGRDYGNDPYIIRKAEDAKKTLNKYGLPKGLNNKK